jgi:2-polyprenyl-3-methyl-5-hydroxy-6-metoxy-1,4-benzoquinol methylase
MMTFIMPPGAMAAWRRRPRRNRQACPAAPLPARPLHGPLACGMRASAARAEAGRQTAEDIMAQQRIQLALANPAIRARFCYDLRHTLLKLGMQPPQVRISADFVIANLRTRQALEASRQEIISTLNIQLAARFETQPVSLTSFHSTISRQLQKQEQALFQQLTRFTGDLQGATLLDFGAADGALEALMRKHAGADVVPVDLEFHQCGKAGRHARGCRSDCAAGMEKPFDGALAINVLAHDNARHQSLARLWALLRPNGKLFVVETIPIGEDRQTRDESLECSFLNDYLMRRIFRGMPALPLPIQGLYELSIESWERCFRAAGFEISHCRHLGCNNEINPNWNVLFVLNKPAQAEVSAKA